MNKFEIYKSTVEMPFKDRGKIEAGCSTGCCPDPELLESFDDKNEALEALKTYHSEIDKLRSNAGLYYHVTEYYVEENVYNDDGEWCAGGDIWDFSQMPEMKPVEKKKDSPAGYASSKRNKEGKTR